MTDITERLRSPEVFIDAGGMNSRVAHEAATEIERLRTEVNQLSTSCGHCGDLERAWAEAERLRAALRRIAHSADYDTIISPDGDRHQRAIEIALETLAGSER